MINRKRPRTILLFLVLLLAAVTGFPATPSSAEWKLRLQKNGVRVWTRPIPGYQVDSYRAEADMAISIDDIFAFLSNVEGFVDWVSGVKKVEILERNESSVLYYISISTPFAQDRDYVGRLSLVPPGNDGSAVIRHESVPDIVPRKPGTIRIADYHETWKLVKLDEKLTRVSMEAFFDPGGELPPAVVNWFVVDAPYGVFETMRKRLGGSKRG